MPEKTCDCPECTCETCDHEKVCECHPTGCGDITAEDTCQCCHEVPEDED